MKTLIDIIQENSLTVRCLPFEVVTHWSYREGDEERLKMPTYLSDGSKYPHKREIITGFGTHPKDKKFIRETRIVENGGWWYVKETKDTSSTVTFNRKYDLFFAPTLEEAIQLYLNSKNKPK